MRFLESKFSTKNEGPWHLFYKYADNKEGKGLGTRGEAAKKLPAPIFWLISPAIFCVAWIWALLWTIQLFAHSSDSGTCSWLWVTLGILFSIAIIVHTIYRWHVNFSSFLLGSYIFLQFGVGRPSQLELNIGLSPPFFHYLCLNP